jgi:hypothetical protein
LLAKPQRPDSILFFSVFVSFLCLLHKDKTILAIFFSQTKKTWDVEKNFWLRVVGGKMTTAANGQPTTKKATY